MDLKNDIISALEWSINEITDNVLNHSKSESGGIVQISTFPQSHSISFAVADSGMGILNSLKESFPQLNSDIIALGEAIKSGVTRNNKYGQGNGLAGTLRIANQTGGNFSLFSGNGKMHYFMSDVKRDSYKDIYYNGTIVTAEIRDDSDNFSIEKALEFHGIKSSQSNIIELNYLSDDCKTFSFVMKNESNGFGNRVVGRLLRRKLHNMINSEKEIPIVIDWSDIPIISSSFADEFIGKLFLELGLIAVSSKTRNIGMEPIIHGLLDKAISQRLTQANDDL
jgi:anti-sigma regulatory factor (Ser/Thr protein kinase)